jgi:hypothetical protein
MAVDNQVRCATIKLLLVDEPRPRPSRYTKNAIHELHNRNTRGLKSLYTKDADGNTSKMRVCTGDGASDGPRAKGEVTTPRGYEARNRKSLRMTTVGQWHIVENHRF